MAKVINVQKHLTNAQLIEILAQRDPNEEVDIFIDYSTCLGGSQYKGIYEDDGICYVEDKNQLVINAGEFEC